MTPPLNTPDTLRIDVGDTELGVIRWSGGPGSPVVFAVHGYMSNAWSWSPVAHHLDGRLSLVAVDLRGRGLSTAASGPYGMRQHGDDLAAIIDRLSAAPAVVVGHSMGAYVALAGAERHPGVIDDLVLVDGGMAVPLPNGMTAREAADALIGPTIEQIQKIWPDRVSYRSTWTKHPAFEGLFTPDVERYLLSDLVECEGGFRRNLDAHAIEFDGDELLTDPEMRSLLDRRQRPATILRADSGPVGTPPPLMPLNLVDRYPIHDWRTVADTNHYSILISDRGATAVAQALLDRVNARS